MTETAVNRLKDIEIELLRTLLAHLHRAVEDDTMVDFRELERASNRGRVQVRDISVRSNELDAKSSFKIGSQDTVRAL